MSEIEVTCESIEAQDIELAQRAAPGAKYYGRVDSVEPEYDDDSGFYMNVQTRFETLYDEDERELSVADPAAYQELFERLGERYSDEMYTSGEHVSAREMMIETGDVNEFALRCAYSEGDVYGLADELPGDVYEILMFAREVGDEQIVEECLEVLRETAYPFVFESIYDVDRKDIAEALAQNPNTPNTLLVELLTETRDEVAAIAMEHLEPPLTERDQELIRTYRQEGNSEDSDPAGQPSQERLACLTAMASSKHPLLRHLVITNNDTPAEGLAQLARDRNSSMRKQVATHPNTGPETLQKLANDRNKEVRQQAATQQQLRTGQKDTTSESQ